MGYSDGHDGDLKIGQELPGEENDDPGSMGWKGRPVR